LTVRRYAPNISDSTIRPHPSLNIRWPEFPEFTRQNIRNPQTLDLGTTPMTKNGTFRGVMKPDLHGECPMILPILPRHTSVYDTNVRRRPLNRPGIVGGSNA